MYQNFTIFFSNPNSVGKVAFSSVYFKQKGLDWTQILRTPPPLPFKYRHGWFRLVLHKYL